MSKRKRDDSPSPDMHPSLRSGDVWKWIAEQLPDSQDGYSTLLGMRAANPAFYRFIRDNPGVAKGFENKFFKQFLHRREENGVRAVTSAEINLKRAKHLDVPPRLLPNTPGFASLAYLPLSNKYMLSTATAAPRTDGGPVHEMRYLRDDEIDTRYDVLRDTMNSEHIEEY